MNGNFDGGRGMYGAVLVGALMELGQLWGKHPKGQAGSAWKRVVMLAVVVTPVALLLAGGLGS
jgi:hypothetical protein